MTPFAGKEAVDVDYNILETTWDLISSVCHNFQWNVLYFIVLLAVNSENNGTSGMRTATSDFSTDFSVGVDDCLMNIGRHGPP